MRKCWLILLVFGIIVLATACVVPGPSASQAPAAEAAVGAVVPPTTIDCADLLSESTAPTEAQIATGATSLPNQLLMTGSPEQIEQVLQRAYEKSAEKLDLRDTKALAREVQLFKDAPDLTLRQYELPAEQNLPETLSFIYQAIAELKVPVSADPNYLFGTPTVAASGFGTTKGDPGSSEGGPGSSEGGPGSSEGGPGSSEGGPSAETSGAITNTTFWGQWAFGDQGIHLIDPATYHRDSANPVGKGVKVAIFDTSPFTQSGGYLFSGSGWITPNLELCVSHLAEPQIIDENEQIDARDHGLFVAGLIHAVAPESEIHLIRTLGPNRRGDLFSIVSALALYLDMRGSLQDTVINLSFGIVAAPPTVSELVERSGADSSAWDAICQANGLACTPLDLLAYFARLTPIERQKVLKAIGVDFNQLLNDLMNEGIDLAALAQLTPAQVENLPTTNPNLAAQIENSPALQDALHKQLLPVAILDQMLQKLHNAGAVIVAAAGNKSNQAVVDAPQIPAAYPYVIGAAGVNYVRERSCFSNQGDVAAPAGDHEGKTCDTSSVADCSAGNPQFCIKSFGLHYLPQTGFVYWTGTSFSAPLVSGLAVLLREKMAGALPSAIVTEIANHAINVGDLNLGEGASDVACTFTSPPLPFCTP